MRAVDSPMGYLLSRQGPYKLTDNDLHDLQDINEQLNDEVSMYWFC